MRILLNGLIVKRGGHKTYFSNFIPEFGKVGSRHEFVLLHSDWQTALNFELPSNFVRLVDGPKNGSAAQRILWEQTRIPSIIRREKIDLVFSPTPSGLVISADYPTVIAVRNPNIFSPIETNDRRYQTRNWVLRMLTKYTVRKASGVIFVSNYSRDEAVKKIKVDPSKLFVIYHGVGSHFFEQAAPPTDLLNIGRPYIFTVSTVQNHKNYLRFLNAFAQLCLDPNFNYDYVFAGAVEIKEEFDRINHRLNQPDLAGRVHYLGEVSNNQLPSVYQNSNLFVLPSLLESFGHPLVEAMASKVPIAASNTAAIPEILGEAGLLFDPYDENDMCRVVLKILENQDIRNQLVAAGEKRARLFSWEKTSQEMIKLFESVGKNEDF